MSTVYLRSFDDADTFLRSRKIKPLSAKVGHKTWLARVDEDTIALRYHSTTVVTYHRGNSVTIWHGGWTTVTTRRKIETYTRVRIHSHKGEWFIGDTGQRTPPRVWKCRCCHGAGTDVRQCTGHHCYGGHWEHIDGRYKRGTCEHGHEHNHLLDTCTTHGLPGGHDLEPIPCWRCKGAGRVDHGSQVIRHRFDEPLLVDDEGTVIGGGNPPHVHVTTKSKPLTHADYGLPKPWKPAHTIDGDTVTGTLTRAIPGLAHAMATPPCGCQDYPTPITTAVIHLNDNHRWTREAIADWLDTLDADLRFTPVTAA